MTPAPAAPVLHMVGNAHIDPVWLWRWPAGVDEALSTFRSAADRCDEYPQFVFTRGEAWLYRWVARLDPGLSARVDALVRRGQWHVTGSMVVQPDANLPTTEGWRRQLRHGRRYFLDRFGLAPTVAYNVDSFGHPASLPDLLAQEGCDAYVFHRPHPDRVALPAPAFRWRGSGGAEVLGFRIVPGYVTRTEDLGEQVRAALDAMDPALGHAMCFYGVGNHGGGPTRANIEWILEHPSVDGAELRFSTPEAFFACVRERTSQLPVVETELQHTFPGCYSVMQDVKRRQRRGELALAGAERAVEQLVEEGPERAAALERLDAAWEDLLFCQFHDVLAGTSIPSSMDAVRDLQGRAALGADELLVEVSRRWAAHHVPPEPFAQLVVINADETAWTGLVEAEPSLDFAPWGERWLSDPAGRRLPCQLVQPEAQALTTRVLFPLELAPGEIARVLVRDDPSPPAEQAPAALEVSPQELRNGRLEAELDGHGVRALRLDGRELLGEGGIGLHLRHDASDTWTHDLDRFPEPVAARLEGASWEVEEAGPLRARVRLEAPVGASRVRWTLTLEAGASRLGLALEVLWAERLMLLQLPIALPAAPASWTSGLAGGAVTRPPSPAEWPVCGWSCAGELALVTLDASSVSLSGDRWQWTLLRSPKAAWGGGRPDTYGGRDEYTDQGAHSFAFALHAGPPPAPAELDAYARRMAAPPLLLERFEGMERRAPGSWPTLFTPISRRKEPSP
jgi:alpha-mannosidase